MAGIYVVEGTDEQKQLDWARKIASAGMEITVHYHKAWESNASRMTIECNEKCITMIDDIIMARRIGLEDY